MSWLAKQLLVFSDAKSGVTAAFSSCAVVQSMNRIVSNLVLLACCVVATKLSFGHRSYFLK